MQYPTRESVAYDLSRFDSREHVRREVKKTEKPHVRRAPRVNVLPVLTTFFICLFAAGAVVFSYMRYTELTDHVSQLRSENDALKTEAADLSAAYETKLNLAYIEEYARDELGMVKLDRSQYEYVELSNPEEVEILTGSNEKASDLMSGLVKSFNVVVEYLN